MRALLRGVDREGIERGVALLGYCQGAHRDAGDLDPVGAELANLAHQLGVQPVIDSPGIEGAHGSTRPVGRQIQARQRCAGKATEPEAFVFGHLGRVGLGRFPGHIVGVAGRGVRAWRFTGLLGVQRAEVFRDESPGPSIAHDVVCGHQKQVFCVAHAQEPSPQQRTLFQRERRFNRLHCGLVELLLALFRAEPPKICHQQGGRPRSTDQHVRAVGPEGAAQCLVPHHQGIECTL